MSQFFEHHIHISVCLHDIPDSYCGFILNVLACKDNLDTFINMEQGTGLGVVMSLKQLVNRFYRPNVNTQAPAPPQPQATAT